MERIKRPIDFTKEDELLLFRASTVATPTIFATPRGIRSRKIAHALWVASTAIASALVFISFVNPIPGVIAQQVTDGRMVRSEEKLSNLTAAVATNSADIKLLTAEVVRLSGQVEGDEKTIKFGGGAIVMLNIIATWFSRQKK